MLNGKPIEKLCAHEKARLGFSFLQSRDHTFAGVTVQEAFRFSKVDKIQSNIEHLSNRQALHLSGGEKQRVAPAYDALSIIDQMAQAGKPISQKALQVEGEWPGNAFKTRFLAGGECEIPCLTIRHQGGINIPLK